MASRPSSRSGGGRRLLIAALIVTIVVVVIDASLKSRSPAPAQALIGQAWIDDVLPVIAASTTEGKVIAQIRTSGPGMSATQISGSLDQAAQAAQRNYQKVMALRAPPSAGGAPGLLQACLLVRAEASQAAARAVTAALSEAPPAAAGVSGASGVSGTSPPAAAGGTALAADPNVAALAAAGRDFTVSDRAYKLFATNVPKSLGVTMPASTWVRDPTVWDATGVQVFLVALRNGTSLAPVHQVSIQAVSTNPPPVGVSAAGVEQIAPTQGVTVTIVVADTGNQPESSLTITAAVAPAAANQTSQVRNFANLTPGTSFATTIGPVVPVSGAPSTLTVTVTPPAGSTTPPASRTLQIEVAPPPPPSTTTTTSTVPAGGSTTTSSVPPG